MINFDIFKLVGNTKLIKVIDEDKHNNIFIKLEGSNPSGSIKDRVFMYYLLNAIENKLIDKNSVLCIPSSGNSSISLATLAMSINIKVRCYMPSSTSVERRKILKLLGADMIFVDENGMEGCIQQINEDCKNNKNYIFVDQFYNDSLYKAHKITAKEIIDSLTNEYKIEELDYFVSGVGTGVTILGISTFLKKKYKNLKTIAFEPMESRGLTKNEFKKHRIEGVMPNFVTDNYKNTEISYVETLDSDEVFKFSKQMIKKGLHLGITSFASLLAAMKIKDINKNILIVSYDNYDKYLEVLNNYEEE